MKTTTLASWAALAAFAAAPAFAQAPATPPAQAQAAGQAAPASAPAAASGGLSVKTTPINTLIKEPRAKAALEKELPDIAQYYDQIGTMTLAEVVPMAGGAITDQNMQHIQAEFDKIK